MSKNFVEKKLRERIVNEGVIAVFVSFHLSDLEQNRKSNETWPPPMQISAMSIYSSLD